MKNTVFLFALSMSIMIFATACSDGYNSQELIKVEPVVVTKEKLLSDGNKIYESLISNKWDYESYNVDKHFLNAHKTNEEAKYMLTLADELINFDLELRFIADGDSITPIVDISPKAGLNMTTALLSLEAKVYGNTGNYIGPDEKHFATIRRAIAGGFAPDSLTANQIANDETGKLTFKFAKKDLSNLSFEELMASNTSNKIIVSSNSSVYIDSGRLFLKALNYNNNFGLEYVFFIKE